MFESFCWAYSLCRDLNSPEQTWTVLNSSSWMCYLTNIPCKNGFYLCFLWWNKQDSHKIGKLRSLRVFSWRLSFRERNKTLNIFCLRRFNFHQIYEVFALLASTHLSPPNCRLKLTGCWWRRTQEQPENRPGQSCRVVWGVSETCPVKFWVCSRWSGSKFLQK